MGVSIQDSDGDARVTLSNDIVHSNGSNGGGVHLGRCSAEIVNCTICDNHAVKFGAGISQFGDNAPASVVTNSIVRGNTSQGAPAQFDVAGGTMTRRLLERGGWHARRRQPRRRSPVRRCPTR
jgi:ribosomal protein S6E (S10)